MNDINMRLTNKPPIFYKSIILTTFLALIIAGSAFGQDQTVTLTTTGHGENLQQATDNALRSAIEQAFGVFISSRTEILNDDLIRDEIVSVASGNILNYRVISEIELAENNYTSTVLSTVSLSNLTNYARGKGIQIEFEGSLFAFNINQQKLNERNELRAILDVIPIFAELASKAYDYNIKAESPFQTTIRDGRGLVEIWKVPLNVEIHVNLNFEEIGNLLAGIMSGLNLSLD